VGFESFRIIAKHRAALSNSLAELKRHLGELPKGEESVATAAGRSA